MGTSAVERVDKRPSGFIFCRK